MSKSEDLRKILERIEQRLDSIEEHTEANAVVATTMLNYVWILDKVSTSLKYIDPRRLIGVKSKKQEYPKLLEGSRRSDTGSSSIVDDEIKDKNEQCHN